MNLITEICGVAVWIMVFIGSVALVVNGVRSEDRYDFWFLISAGVLSLLFIVGLTTLFLATTKEENDNPCIAWGPPETHYQMVGKIPMPVTRTPCIQRQNSTER